MSQKLIQQFNYLFIIAETRIHLIILMEKEKDKDRAELYLEYIADGVRELVVNFSDIGSELSTSLAQKGEFFYR